jgi:hypothetical protein
MYTVVTDSTKIKCDSITEAEHYFDMLKKTHKEVYIFYKNTIIKE